LPTGILSEKLFKTFASGLVGYAKLTFLNSILSIYIFIENINDHF